MTKRKNPRLANKFAVRLGINFYGKGYFKKYAPFVDDGTLRNIKPPYIVAVNHASFADVGGIAMMMYPKYAASYIASKTQFAEHGNILDYVGVIEKKQFSIDTGLIRDVKYILGKGRPVVLYPESKLSVDGTANQIKPSIAKLVKMFNVPLVTVCFNGSYLHKPRWAKDKRKVPLTVTAKLAVTREETQTLSVEEIYKRIVQNLTYDDYRYQRENCIEISSATLTEGLECILYKCPECGRDFSMSAHGNTLKCDCCGMTATMDKFGVLSGKFSSVPQWYAWQRNAVAEEVSSGGAVLKLDCRCEKIVKNKFVDVGSAEFVFDNGAITVNIEGNRTLSFKRGMFYTLSFNNKYVFLPAETVYRLSFGQRGITTKLNLAVEEIAKLDLLL
ncbi:MAG: 1-acyl-sn-glycerol-3-phosphate acyltransferase [Corallococcus sp.]|nr:1-acyl-sn-glycerol-3-phosphate acyltransferase [Corallococcus sp.]